METPDELDGQFEDAWENSSALNQGATLKQIAKLWWLKGRAAGITAGMKLSLPDNSISPEDEAKLASVTIRETFNHELYGQVLEAQKYSS
jgi:hypothetical protein